MADGLHYLELGSGRPLLLMHGGMGFDHTYFRPELDELSLDAHLTYYDHRGNGRSADPEDWSALTHETWVDDAEVLRRTVYDDRPIVLLGHSYGGFLAIEYALRYPRHLEGLALCATGPAIAHLPEAVQTAQARLSELPNPEPARLALESMRTGPPADDASMRDMLLKLLPLYFAEPAKIDVEALVDRMDVSADALRRSFYELLEDYDVRDRLNEIRVPTLILFGRQDWLFPPQFGGIELAERIPRAGHQTFDRCGHFPFLEEPQRFCDIVMSWLSEL